MKKIIYSILILLIFTACGQKEPFLTKAEEIVKVENLLEKYMMAIENQDFQMIENVWYSSDSSMLLGTDSKDRLMGWENIRKAYRNQFGLISNTYISVQDQFININETKNTAWFSQRMSYNFIYDSIARSFEGMRFTGVLVKDKNQSWKMAQGHLSVPAQVNIGE